jgi:predicted DNA-binding transcriptional regulator AlpA
MQKLKVSSALLIKEEFIMVEELIQTKGFIKAHDFIKAIGISKATLYRGIKADKYPYCCNLRLGDSKHIYFPKDLLTELCTNALKGGNKAGGLN